MTNKAIITIIILALLLLLAVVAILASSPLEVLMMINQGLLIVASIELSLWLYLWTKIIFRNGGVAE